MTILLVCTSILFNIQMTNAANVFRPSQNSNIEQSNAYIPQILLPTVRKIRALQAQYLNQVTENLRSLKQDKAALISVSLILLSFLYGLLHAAGPGHGKAVISAYLLSSKAELKQGIQIAFFASMMQAITAIILVFTGLFIFKSSIRQINQNFAYFELFSYLLILSLGVYLFLINIKKALNRHPKSKLHQHDEDCGCGHEHIPAPRPSYTIKQKLLTIASIGIRPCTGALIILILAHSLALYWVAIFATFIMALGTFITIAIVATFAVSVQKIFKKMTLGLSNKYKIFYIRAIDGFKIAFSLFIILIGGLLTLATL